MRTKAFDVKKRVVDLAKALPTVVGDRVQTTYGWPTSAPERRWVMVGEVTWDDSEWVTNRSRQEIFSIAILFNVQMTRGTAEEVEQAAVKLGQEFEETVMADPGFAGLAVTSNLIPRKLASWPSDGVFEANYEASLRVTARP